MTTVPPSEQDPLLPTSNADDAELRTSSYRRQWLAQKLDSHAMHWTVLILVALDVGAVLADLTYSFLSESCPPESAPDPLWLHILQHVSQGITAAFLAEIPLEIYAFGWHFYNPVKFPLHAFDLVVIIATFVFEMVLSGREQEIAGLVVLLRLWRLVRLAGGVALGVGKEFESEVGELRFELSEKRKELESAQLELQQLRQRLDTQVEDV